jgi:plastocyanin
MKGSSTRAIAAIALIVVVVAAGSFYYPRANPGSASSTAGTIETSVLNTSSSITSFSEGSTTQSFTLTFSSSTSTATTDTDKQVTIIIPFGAHYALDGPHGAYYQPENVTILAGATVTWVNHDNFTMGVQADNGAFYRGTIQPRGGTYSFTFNTPGKYTYRCTTHSWMSGEIDVISA